MRKRVYGKQLGRNTNSRKALFRSLIASFVEHGKVKTTLSKAKAVQPEIEKILTKAKTDSVHARRVVLARLGNDREVLDKMFSQFVSISGNRDSGYTKITKLPRRRGDNTQEALIEWVDTPVVAEEVKEETAKKSTKK